MGTLLDLIAGLAPAPAVTTTAAPLIAVTSAPAANDLQQPAREPQHAPALAERAPEPASEPRRAAWPITRGGKPIGYMVGQPITYAEALIEARWRWPDAKVRKY